MAAMQPMMNDPDLVEAILDSCGLSVVFQPIFEITRRGVRLHALESLSRGPKGTPWEQPDVLFDRVRAEGAEVVADRACVQNALREAGALPGEPNLAVNVHACTLELDGEFPVFLQDVAREHGISTERVTVEIIEYSPVSHQGLCRALFGLRRLGVRIALDDIGAGDSNYRRMLDCRPDYFKIDRYFVQGAHQDAYRRAVLESVAELARKFGARVVAEGVEERADLELLESVGIDLVQGFLLCRPLAARQLIARDILTGACPVAVDQAAVL